LIRTVSSLSHHRFIFDTVYYINIKNNKNLLNFINYLKLKKEKKIKKKEKENSQKQVCAGAAATFNVKINRHDELNYGQFGP